MIRTARRIPVWENLDLQSPSAVPAEAGRFKEKRFFTLFVGLALLETAPETEPSFRFRLIPFSFKNPS